MKLKVAVLQYECPEDVDNSIKKLDEMVLRARHPKINRSALMRVAMEELEKYPDDKLQEVIANYFKNDLENN